MKSLVVPDVDKPNVGQNKILRRTKANPAQDERESCAGRNKIKRLVLQLHLDDLFQTLDSQKPSNLS